MDNAIQLVLDQSAAVIEVALHETAVALARAKDDLAARVERAASARAWANAAKIRALRLGALRYVAAGSAPVD